MRMFARPPSLSRSSRSRFDVLQDASYGFAPSTLRGQIMWFELGLVERGVISADDFVLALRQQLVQRPPFGRIAIAEGYLTVPQLFDVLTRQADTQEPVGEAAVALGYITISQLAEILMKQSAMAGSLSDSLLATGVVDDGTLSRERRRFLSENMDISGVYMSAREREPVTASLR